MDGWIDRSTDKWIDMDEWTNSNDEYQTDGRMDESLYTYKWMDGWKSR